jgi:hypothetical protein
MEYFIGLGGLSVSTVPSDEINKNPETEVYVKNLSLLFSLSIF